MAKRKIDWDENKLKMFFASENSSLLQKVFLRHRWGIFMLTLVVLPAYFLCT